MKTLYQAWANIKVFPTDNKRGECVYLLFGFPTFLSLANVSSDEFIALIQYKYRKIFGDPCGSSGHSSNVNKLIHTPFKVIS